jgi:CRP/FNR family cyclic AMP-dependent transcriptional regulator
MEELEILRKVPLFSEMDDKELAGVLEIMDTCTFIPGQVIIREGDEGGNFYVITEGTVEFVSSDAEGHELILDEAGPGQYFGELSMLTGLPRTLRVRAKDKVLAKAFDRSEFHDFLKTHPEAAIDVLTVLGHRLYRTDALLRKSVSRNVNEVIEEQLTLGQRIADGFAAMMGSWPFIIIQSMLLLLWVGLNITAWVNAWDPYPFILLNLALSFQAAYAAPIIMMSQNRASDKDRLAAEIDHQVNVKAELKVSLIMSRLDDIERGMHYLHQNSLRAAQEVLNAKASHYKGEMPQATATETEKTETKNT